MNRTCKIVCLLLCLAFSFSEATAQTKAYINKYRSLADSLAAAYSIPVGVILGIAVVESSSGAGRNVKLLNNHFGIVGKNHLMKAKKIKTRYKYYANATESYISFCNLMTRKKFYKKLKGNLNYKLWLMAISKAGYSELPSVWIPRITSIIKTYRLSATR
jgi:flagellum-specific peptidoglycan hydrolase FlgJ